MEQFADVHETGGYPEENEEKVPRKGAGADILDGSPIPLPIAPAPIGDFDNPQGFCPAPPTRLFRECFELGLCV